MSEEQKEQSHKLVLEIMQKYIDIYSELTGLYKAMSMCVSNQPSPVENKTSCWAVFDEDETIVQLYGTKEKAEIGLAEFEKSHPHTEFFVDEIDIN